MNNRSRQNRSERGYTLTEIVVAVAIFSIIFVAALLVYDKANRVFKDSMEASDLQQNTRVGFDKLVSELRMAGFDFDRDGPVPEGENKYQQPDEQLEFIHPHAITFRTNLNYEDPATTDNGRETDYEPGFGTAPTDDDFFPVVTTSNEEIITYALRSDNGANDDLITFYVDKARPRRSYPDTLGQDETLVTIRGVDLCQDGSGTLTGCLEPPYTLVRITLKDDGSVGPAVPVASNVRSMTLEYFVDAVKSVTVTPNGGIGQYLVTGPTTAPALAARDARATVRAIDLTLVGMNESRAANYVDPIEAALDPAMQVPEALDRRQYQLSSTIVPRNLGKRGLKELETEAPGAPRITNVCWGACGVAMIQWAAPPTGSVDSYDIVYDTNPIGQFNSTPEFASAAPPLFSFVDGLDPNATYYFKVIAKNNIGSTWSLSASAPLQPRNATRPSPPTDLVASGDPVTPGAPPAVPDDINLSWTTPSTNVPFGSGPQWFGGCTLANPSDIPSAVEDNGYEIHRDTTPGFTPVRTGAGTTKISGSGYFAEEDLPPIPGLTATFVDSTPKVNCTTYYYKILTYEKCATTALNNSGDVVESESDFSAQAEGRSLASANPSAPQDTTAVATSSCSSDPCVIDLEWDEVTTDVAGNPIQISEYTVKRVTYVSGVPGSEVPDPAGTAIDSIIGDGKVTYTDNTAPAPPAGTIYHYTIAARQCSTYVSDYSSPDVKFPCVLVTVAPPPGVIDGAGSELSPWVLEDTVDLSAVTDTDLVMATATAYDYPARSTATPLPGGIDPVDPRAASFSFALPGGDDVFEIEMVFTDVNGCSLTVRRYVQESPTSCCLLPFKDDSGTVFDASVLVVTPGGGGVDPFITLTLKNQCDSDLTIESLRLVWTGFGTTGASNNLGSITYPGGIVDSFGGTVDNDGSHTFFPASAGASTTIPAGSSSYSVKLTFTRSASTTVDTITNFCVVYTKDGVTDPGCSIAQQSNSACPLP
jgi:prepilin-type N-terminal cleavage/methylation domain-containing protein